eukprot:1566455-Pyramimonas_sp.AAC.1
MSATPEEQYDELCQKHEIYVVIENVEAHRKIRFRLQRKHSDRGRSLTMNVQLPNQPLLFKGDRLEPTATMLDVRLFDSITEFPKIVKFWRASGNERTYHRNPMLDPALGIGMHTFSLDELHCLHLGVFQVWAAHVVWKLLMANVYGVNAPLQDDRIRLGLQHLRVELDQWYDSEPKKRKGKEITRIGDLTPGMIGTKGPPSLGMKAQETKWFTYFLVDIVPKYAARPPNQCNVDVVLAAGRALINFSNILDDQPRKIPDNVCKQLQELAELHVGLAESCGIPMYPKHHLFRHLAAQICRKGNPRYYNTYWDETVNGVIKQIASSCHRARFERMVFRKCGYLKTEGALGWGQRR